MAQIVDIRTDFTEIQEYLDSLEKYSKPTIRYILSRVGAKSARKVKKSYNVYLHKRTNNLYRNVKAKTSKRGLYTIISSNGTSDDKHKARYGYVLAKGTTIKAKNSKYLTFQIDGKWKKVKQVKLESKNFIEEPILKYLNSSEVKRDIDTYLQKKLDQLEKKGKITITEV